MMVKIKNVNLLEDVVNGKKFRVDFKEKSLKVNGKYIIEKGECNREEQVAEIEENATEFLENLYEQYRTSVPSVTVLGSESYFKALDVEELTDSQLAYNLGRNEAQALLEEYVLCNREELYKEMFEGNQKWFWQSLKYKELVILREWL